MEDDDKTFDADAVTFSDMNPGIRVNAAARGEVDVFGLAKKRPPARSKS